MAEMPAESVSMLCCDPPYGLEFMGKEWDKLDLKGSASRPGTSESARSRSTRGANHGIHAGKPAFDLTPDANREMQKWHHAWLAEVYRVLEPGGVAKVFGGSRVFHRLAAAMVEVGFIDIQLEAWGYGSGFPKSLNVGKALDKMDATQEQGRRRLRFTAWVRSTGVTSKQIDEATGTRMGGHYTTDRSQPAVMTREHLEACRHLFEEIPEWVELEVGVRSVESENFKQREVLEERTLRQGGGTTYMLNLGPERRVEANITAAHSPEARFWEGWGTALKPSWEPVLVGRKP
jgi:site-specific DNA-methyltransferase (adenine-specific)